MNGFGTLYLVSTPIGNMEDITLRAIRVMKEVDMIAAEDTRQTVKLLNRYDIKTHMTSYHEHNARTKGEFIVNALKEGKNIALVSDAGTPGISDPGEDIAIRAIKEGITVTPVPGASAVLPALLLSGFTTDRFVFEGFLSKKKSDKKKAIEALTNEIRTVVIYESPHKLFETLQMFAEKFPERNISVIREMTKKFEQIWSGTVKEAVAKYSVESRRGEYVIVLEGVDEKELKNRGFREWDGITYEEQYRSYLKQGLEKKEAMRKIAESRGVSKREIYRIINLDKGMNFNKGSNDSDV
ncbi:MAG: 16S rRNA (cytidine(1402)-2'-O)-methyltransferase [Eubacteriales bacterium]|nr:16S rRNA (cytidine(1402)-2'-O)-methyltransferase [Eubacteriales bacterium]